MIRSSTSTNFSMLSSSESKRVSQSHFYSNNNNNNNNNNSNPHGVNSSHCISTSSSKHANNQQYNMSNGLRAKAVSPSHTASASTAVPTMGNSIALSYSNESAALIGQGRLFIRKGSSSGGTAKGGVGSSNGTSTSSSMKKKRCTFQVDENTSMTLASSGFPSSSNNYTNEKSSRTPSAKRISFNLSNLSFKEDRPATAVSNLHSQIDHIPKSLRVSEVEKAQLYRWLVQMDVLDAASNQKNLRDISQIDALAGISANGSMFVKLVDRVAQMKGIPFLNSSSSNNRNSNNNNNLSSSMNRNRGNSAGVFLNAKNAAQANVNFLKIFAFLRQYASNGVTGREVETIQGMSSRSLSCEQALKEGNIAMFWGFLQELYAWSMRKRKRNTSGSAAKRRGSSSNAKENNHSGLFGESSGNNHDGGTYESAEEQFDYESICSSQHAKQLSKQHKAFSKLSSVKKQHENPPAQLIMHPTTYSSALSASFAQSVRSNYELNSVSFQSNSILKAVNSPSAFATSTSFQSNSKTITSNYKR